MSKRIIELHPQLDELTLSQMEDLIEEKYHLRAEIFGSMFHKQWSVNNYFVDTKKWKKVYPEGDISKKFDNRKDAQELAVWELLKLI